MADAGQSLEYHRHIMTSRDEINVFVSSTSEDLEAHRAVARNLILNMGWQPAMMEDMGALTQSTVPACLELVETSALMILIVAYRQGWVPSEEQGGSGGNSITALELAHARDKNIPVLIFLADDNWPGKLWEKDQQAREWVESFRANLNQPAEFFGLETDPKLPDFRSKVRAQLAKHKEELSASKARANGMNGDGNHFSQARDAMLESRNVPFIGPFIYGSGPLSPEALAEALVPPEGKLKDPPLAVAAEHREAWEGSRSNFLNRLTECIKEQSAQAKPSGVHDLVATMAEPWFVVYAGLDRKLEERLDAAQKSYVVVTHITHSFNSEFDGKILVLRKDQEPEICAPGELPISFGKTENVIYRPMGSPLLHEVLDDDLQLDTVVITESDHLTFLRNSEHQDTQIPPRVTRWLVQRPLLFLGYPMDLWHFRLIMRVFQSNGRSYRQAATYAVRKVDENSTMEALAWRRLSANLIPVELKEFVEQATGASDSTHPAGS